MQIISRDNAISLGLKRYFTGEPCKNGHLNERMVSNWRCITCLRIARNSYITLRRKTRPGSYSDADKRAHIRHASYKANWAKQKRIEEKNKKPTKPLKPRVAARKDGKSQYFTGKPCIKGHLSNRFVNNGQCIACSVERYRRWLIRNPKRRAHYDSVRRARLAHPQWSDHNVIIKIYDNCPTGMVVDHIVPLQGWTVEGYRVSGLHVSWNLQYLSKSANSKKRNYMRPEDEVRLVL